MYDLYGNVPLDRVSVSNPQRLTSTQILVHYPPPPDYVIASLYKTHLVDKLMHSKAYRPNVELFHETNQIQRVKVAEHSFAGGQRLRVFSMRQTNLVTKKAMVHQWYTEDDNSKSTHEHFEIFGRIFTFIVFLIMRTLKWKLNRRIL